MKRILSLGLVLVMLCALFSFTSADAEMYGDLTYKNCGDYIEITGCDKSVVSVNIPETIDNLPVKNIGSYAFEDCTSLTNVSISNSVTDIGFMAFYRCESLSSIRIPDSVINIGISAFSGCVNLKEINISRNVTNIGDSAFEGCVGLISVNIPSSVTNIGDSVFEGCVGLTDVTIQNGVTSIGNSMFYKCSSLTSVSIPDSTTDIGYSAFSRCTNLTSIIMPDSVKSIGAYAFENTEYYNNSDNWSDDVLYIGNHLIKANFKQIASYSVRSGTKCIANSAFSGCWRLIDIIISDGVTNIGDSTFASCYDLTSVTIPDSLTSIGNKAFYNCRNLTSLNIPNGVTDIGDMAFAGCSGLTYINIPESVISIGKQVFLDCSDKLNIEVSLKNNNYSSIDGVLFNKDQTEIIKYAKDGIQPDYIIPSSVIRIGDYAFQGCDNLISVTIPNSVTSIGSLAFNCFGLSSIIIPDSVTEIANRAFSSCTSLTSIIVSDSVKSIGRYAFENTEYYNNSDNWSDGVLYLGNHLIGTNPEQISGEYIIKNGTKCIADYAFENCGSLTSVVMPNSVTSIGSWAFADCNGLTDVYYFGAKNKWSDINIGENNDCLINANIHFDEEPIPSLTPTDMPSMVPDYNMTKSDVVVQNDIIIVNTSLDNLIKLEDKEKSEVYVVLYDKNDAVIDVYSAVYDGMNIEGELKNSNIADHIKVFVWNKDGNLEPITGTPEYISLK